MTQRIASLLAVLLAASLAAHAQGTSPVMAERISLSDPALNNMTALTLDLPAGWHAQGVIIRGNPCAPAEVYPQFRAESADGLETIELLPPVFRYSEAEMDVEPVRRSCGLVVSGEAANSAADLLTQHLVPMLHPALTVPPAEPIAATEPYLRLCLSDGTLTLRPSAASRVRLSYGRPGLAFEEWLIAIPATSPSGGTATVVLSVRAPKGRLNQVTGTALAGLNQTVNPAWQQRLNRGLPTTQSADQEFGQITPRKTYASQVKASMQAIMAHGSLLEQPIPATYSLARYSPAPAPATSGGGGIPVSQSATFHWLNQSSGEKRYTTTATPPGPDWTQIQ